jgi:UDP-GlcNAc3NAcA epimerase
MKILTIIGARPQFIKAAKVSRAIKQKGTDIITEVIIHTGQHYDENMSAVFFDEMDIPKPDYFLNIESRSHGGMTGEMLKLIEPILLNEAPDWVLVYGDTNSTLAGALAASKLHIKIAHVEAGLRSYNMQMPEEVNRILTDRISNLLFCPTKQSIENLKNEGYDQFNSVKIIECGDVMYDAALFYTQISTDKPQRINSLGLSKNNFILATIHRAENTDNFENLRSLNKVFNELSKTYSIVLPLHPRTQKISDELGLKWNIKIIEPVGYFDMLNLLQNCGLVITDSGGLQKEAYFFNKYCITTRTETEWVELVSNGFNFVTGTDNEQILNYSKKVFGKQIIKTNNLYGNGNAAEKIVESLLNN